jgi:lipoprotein-releasing system permease protein
MENDFYIALRFLLAKKRAMLMSLSGIIFGVGLFIVTQAQTAGFEHFFIRTVLGTDGALRVQDRFQDTIASMTIKNQAGQAVTRVSLSKERRYVIGVQYPSKIMEGLLKFENVTGASAVLRGNVQLDTNFRQESAEIFGINLEDHLNVSDLAHQIIFGTLDDFRANPKGAIIGSMLADRVNVTVGDSIVLSQAGRSARFRVSAIFESGVEHVDKQRVLVHLPEARAILAQPFDVTYIQANLRDTDRAPGDADEMQEVLGHSVEPWQEREKIWLDVFHALRASSALTVSTIILIAGLGMFNTLAMIVMEKTKEIAILRSMGYTRRDISRIFLLQGALVLLVGSILGCLLGALSTLLVSSIPLRIRGIFSTDHFVVYWSPWHYLAAVLSATVVVMIASWVPARRAARLEPGEIIRGTAA